MKEIVQDTLNKYDTTLSEANDSRSGSPSKLNESKPREFLTVQACHLLDLDKNMETLGNERLRLSSEV